MNEQNPATEPLKDSQPSTPAHPIATGVGAAGGGIVGAAIGNSIGGKLGAAVGGIAGAIAGGALIAEFAEEVIQETQPSFSLGLGADTKEIELPAHYSWEELQALSQPHAN
jgi:outer membrane lipoprotein SlyB